MANIRLNAAQRIVDTGILPAYQGGLTAVDTFLLNNDGRTFLHLKKGANACNVTLKSRANVRGKAVADQVVVLGANSELMIGPLAPDFYNDVNSDAAVLFSEVTGLTAAVLQI